MNTKALRSIISVLILSHRKSNWCRHHHHHLSRPPNQLQAATSSPSKSMAAKNWQAISSSESDMPEYEMKALNERKKNLKSALRN